MKVITRQQYDDDVLHLPQGMTEKGYLRGLVRNEYQVEGLDLPSQQQSLPYNVSIPNPNNGSFLGNVARGANREIVGFGRGVLDRMANPSKLGEDVKNLATLAAGTLAGTAENIYQGVTGKQVPQFNPDMTVSYPEGGTKEQQIADAVGQSLAGVVQHPIQTFENHPIMTSLIVVPALRALASESGMTGKLTEIAGQVKRDIGENYAKDAIAGLPSKIEKGIAKSIRPSVSGKQTFNDIGKYYDNADIAVQSIVKNKGALNLTNEFGELNPTGLPHNLQQFSDAIGQTKKAVYEQYNALSKQAGGQGAMVNTKNVAHDLVSTFSDPKFAAIEDQSPEIAEYISKRATALETRGAYTPEQAEIAIKNYNDSLSSFYKNPSIETFQRTSVDAMIANNLRKALDSTILDATGEQYAVLKKQYGALKAIEKDTLNAAMVNARKNAKGMVDFSNIFSAGDLIAGLATGNPMFAAKGAVQMGIAKYFKFLNNPNQIVKSMFEKVDSALTSAEEYGITGASKTKVPPTQLMPKLGGTTTQSPTLPPETPPVNLPKATKSPKKK